MGRNLLIVPRVLVLRQEGNVAVKLIAWRGSGFAFFNQVWLGCKRQLKRQSVPAPASFITLLLHEVHP